MKINIVATAAIVSTLALLASCNGDYNQQPNTADTQTATVKTLEKHGDQYHSVQLWIDPITGCQYLKYWTPNGANLSPRLDQNSQIICEKTP